MYFEEIIHQSKNITRNGDAFYSALSLKEMIIAKESIEIDSNLYMSPFYIDDNRIYELYEYELEILKNSEEQFTIRTRKGMPTLEGDNIKANIIFYIDYILKSKDVKLDIESIFRLFLQSNIYFYYYTI